MKLTFRTRKSGLMASPQSQKNVESRVQHRSGCTARVVARFKAHLSNGHMMEYVWQDTHTDASTRNKQKNQCQTMGRLESSVAFRHNGQQSSEHLHKNKNRQEQRFNHGPNSRGSVRGWRKVNSKSTSTHALLPAMSSIALETRAVHSRELDLSGLRLLRMRSIQLEIQSPLRRAMPGQGAASEPQCTNKAGIQR